MARYLSLSDFLESTVYKAWKQTRRNQGISFILLGCFLVVLILLLVYLTLIQPLEINLFLKWLFIPLIELMLFGMSVFVIYVGYSIIKKPDPSWVLFGEVMMSKSSYMNNSKRWKKRDYVTKRDIILTDGSVCNAKMCVPCSHFASVHMPVIAFGWFENPDDVWATKAYFSYDEKCHKIPCKQSNIVEKLGL